MSMAGCHLSSDIGLPIQVASAHVLSSRMPLFEALSGDETHILAYQQLQQGQVTRHP